jgi:hypothetical protein
MHIKTRCPRCESTFQVDPGLKGKRMRCPNPICRTVFEVRDDAQAVPPPTPPPPPPAPAPTPSPKPARSGAVGELVPILPAEPAVVEQPPFQPTPRRKPPAPPKPQPEPEPAPAAAEVAVPTAEQQAALDAFFAGAAPIVETRTGDTPVEPGFLDLASAPPVRQGDAALLPSANGEGTAAVLPPYEPLPAEAPAPRRWQRKAALLLALLIVAGGTTWWLFLGSVPGDEAGRFARAEKDYNDRNFTEAAERFHALFADFPDSPDRPKYQFYAELSELRGQAELTHTAWDDTRLGIENLKKFVEFYAADPLLDKHKADLAETLYHLVEETIPFAEQQKSRPILEWAERLYKDGARFGPARPKQAEEIQAKMADASEKIRQVEERDRLLEQLRQFAVQPSANAVAEARQLAAGPKLAADAEVQELVRKVEQAHRQSVRFSREWIVEALPGMAEDASSSLAVLPYLQPSKAPTFRGRPVFALARGVLYALDPANGQLRWARRLGADSQTLPVWLPATALAAEAVLVAAPDAGGLVALDAQDGGVLWFLPLRDVCPGPMLVVGQRALVACRYGAVIEVDVVSGRGLGAYFLGQPLAWQGVPQPGTNLAFFAADRQCVYAVDVAQRQCAGILYSNHADGSLLCAPIVIPLLPSGVVDPKTAAPRGKLLLSVARGPAATDVLTCGLPLTGPQQQPALLQSLPGRLWFPPRQNGEYLTIVSDAGALALYGIKQPNTLDPDLFSLPVKPLANLSGAPSPPGAQVVAVDAGDFLLLAGQHFHHLRAALDAKAGWGIEPQFTGLKALGSPLQDAQVRTLANGTRALFLVTQSPDGSNCWVTAVDSQASRVLWQRQLGWMCKGHPAAVGNDVLARDADGSLLRFAAGDLAPLPGAAWQEARHVLTDALTPGKDDGWLLPAPDGKSIYVLAVHGLEARVLRFAGGAFVGPAWRYTLEAAPSGTPALFGDSVVLPLAKGLLCRLLPPDGQAPARVDVGKGWRSKEADTRAVGHVVALGPELVACTNGNSGLTLWRVDGQAWKQLATATVGGRIVGPPAVVPLPGKPGGMTLCVADTARGVTLLDADGLRPLRHWELSGHITAGPFAYQPNLGMRSRRAGLRGGVGVILDGRRLVWLNPERDEVHFAHTFRADIAGQPQLIDDVLIVADAGGHLQAVNPWAKCFVGPGYTLLANVAPSAAPVPFGPGRLLVPLTDGTALVLARDWFHAENFLGFSTER